jgi:hypothetical protein
VHLVRTAYLTCMHTSDRSAEAIDAGRVLPCSTPAPSRGTDTAISPSAVDVRIDRAGALIIGGVPGAMSPVASGTWACLCLAARRLPNARACGSQSIPNSETIGGTIRITWLAVSAWTVSLLPAWLNVNARLAY